MKRLTYAIAAAATAAAAAAGGATTSANAATFSGCTPVTGGQTYLAAYGDTHSYVLAPGGDFSTPNSTWTAGGAAITSAEQSPADVTGSGSDGALVLTPGDTASAPQMCLGSKDERLRLFYKAPAGTTFKVTTSSTSSLGTYTMNTWVTARTNGWNLSPEILIPDWTDGTNTQRSKVAISNPTHQNVVIDDVLVDPWRARSW